MLYRETRYEMWMTWPLQKMANKIEIALSREVDCRIDVTLTPRYQDQDQDQEECWWCNRVHESRSCSPTEAGLLHRSPIQPITARKQLRIDVTRQKRRAWKRDRTRSRKFLVSPPLQSYYEQGSRSVQSSPAQL